MRSFRLDRDSIPEFIESWPVLLAGVAVTAGLAYLGWLYPVWRIFLVLYAGTYVGYVARGRLRSSLADRYPNARFIPLLSIGLSVATLGVVIRMIQPQLQGAFLDITWIVVSFCCILAFILLNRHDPDVVQ